MDQVVAHLSLNHASLPRVHLFLRNLQTGMGASIITTNDPTGMLSNSYSQRLSNTKALDVRTTQRPGFSNMFRSTSGREPVSMNNDGHCSEDELRLKPAYVTEMTTFVTGGDGDSTSSTAQMDDGEKATSNDSWGQSNRIKVVETIEITSGRCESRQIP